MELLNALFYKAGKCRGVFCRIRRSTGQAFSGLASIGISMANSSWTSTAQMFDERGRGLIFRGARAQTETQGRHPYLTRRTPRIGRASITAYKAHHRHVPARVVVRKTSRFRPKKRKASTRLSKSSASKWPICFGCRKVRRSRCFGTATIRSFAALRRSEWEGTALYARQRPVLRDLSGPACPRPLLLVPHENTTAMIVTLAKDVSAAPR